MYKYVFAFMLTIIILASPSDSDETARHSKPDTNAGKECAECHDAKDSGDNDGIDSLKNSAHAGLSCVECHYGYFAEKHRTKTGLSPTSAQNPCKRCHTDKFSAYTERLHYKIQSSDVTPKPTCTDCHGHHNAGYTVEERATLVSNCGRCHEKVFSIYKESIHGAALLSEDNRDVPACLDCHTAHSTGNSAIPSNHRDHDEICRNCHGNEQLMEEYGLATDVLKTYVEIFHTKIVNKEDGSEGSSILSHCINCHGTHDISTNLETEKIKNRLKTVCNECHSDESPIIPDEWISHYIPSLTNTPILFFVTFISEGMLYLLVTGFFFQLFIHAWRYMVGR